MKREVYQNLGLPFFPKRDIIRKDIEVEDMTLNFVANSVKK